MPRLLVCSSEIVRFCAADRRRSDTRSYEGVRTVTRVMNVDEVAKYLRVVPDTIYRKARRGEIPAVKMGKVWRFPKETIDKWLNDSALETVKKD